MKVSYILLLVMFIVRSLNILFDHVIFKSAPGKMKIGKEALIL